jgi:hypothetical protein
VRKFKGCIFAFNEMVVLFLRTNRRLVLLSCLLFDRKNKKVNRYEADKEDTFRHILVSNGNTFYRICNHWDFDRKLAVAVYFRTVSAVERFGKISDLSK